MNESLFDQEAKNILLEHSVSPEMYFEWVREKSRQTSQRTALIVGLLITILLNAAIFSYFAKRPENNIWPMNLIIFLVFGIGLGGTITWGAWRQFKMEAVPTSPLMEQMILRGVIWRCRAEGLRRLTPTQWQDIREWKSPPRSVLKKNEGTFLNEADRIRYEKLHVWRRISGWSALLIWVPLFFIPWEKFLSIFFVFLGLFFMIQGYQTFLARWVKAGGRGLGGTIITGKWARVYGVINIAFGMVMFGFFGILGLFIM